MTQPHLPHAAQAPRPAATAQRFGLSHLRGWRVVLVLFYTAVALTVIGFTGFIALNAVQNHGLVPPPRALAPYDCTGADTPFVFQYLHGTERVKISTATGVLEGTLHNNQLDWGSFGSDASQLGFVPPTEISAQDAQSLTLRGPGAFTMPCFRSAPERKASPAH